MIPRRRLFINLIFVTSLFILLFFMLNVKVTSKKGINYSVSIIKMPLYIKLIEFVDRDYHYKKIVNDITKGYLTDQDRILAIFRWTSLNIKPGIPEGWPVVDDHVLNIIIRGYGAQDQSADVFTTLCVYAGIPAVMYRVSPKDSKSRMTISLVQLDKRWLVFDTYRGIYFRNASGSIASLEDLKADPSIVDKAADGLVLGRFKYADYFNNLFLVGDIDFVRGKKHMPWQRLFFEIRKKFCR